MQKPKLPAVMCAASKAVLWRHKMRNDNGLIKKALALEWFTVSYNIVEGIVSVGFGVLAGSIALVGFGLDSAIEVSAAAILIWRLSHRGSDEEAEEKEKKALRFVGITFFALAAYVLYESVSKLYLHEMPEKSIAGIIITALSLLIMPFLSAKKKKVAKQIGSRALEADAMETMICAYLSFAVLLGLTLNGFLGWWWADPVAGLAIVYFAVKEGLEVVKGEECCSKD